MEHEITFVVLASLFGWFLAFGVGANDLANILSTTLGSKSVTLRQAIIIALIFEFLGALLGGKGVAATVQHGIIDSGALQHTANIFIYGMLASLLAASVWITLASHLGIPVSLTNSIVGGVVGFGSLILGWHAIHWHKIGSIALSWVICPITATIFAATLFFLIQRLIFSKEQPLVQAQKYLPYFLFIVGFVLAEMTVLKALEHFGIFLPIWLNLLVASFCSILILLVGTIFLKPIFLQPRENHHVEFALVEKAFAVLMAFSACAMVYAHGSNDIATATGPVAAVVSLIEAGHPKMSGMLLLMVLAFGYIGVVFGFLVFGRKVVETVGIAITELTPSRAFCATFAAAVIVVTSTTIGIPVSATQTLVGAVLGVGLARGLGALDLRVVRNIFLSWVITIPITAGLTALFFYLFRVIFGIS